MVEASLIFAGLKNLVSQVSPDLTKSYPNFTMKPKQGHFHMLFILLVSGITVLTCIPWTKLISSGKEWTLRKRTCVPRNPSSAQKFVESVHTMYNWSLTGVSKSDWDAEMPEQILIASYLCPGDGVFELGGNIGRSSVLAAKVVFPGVIHTVEADATNRKKIYDLGKEFVSKGTLHILPAVSDRPLYQQSWFVNDNPETPSYLKEIYPDMKDEDWKEIETMPIGVMKTIMQNKQVLLIDCEGCGYSLILNNQELLENIHTIILERDGGTAEAEDFVSLLLKKGYVEKSNPTVCPDNTRGCLYSVFVKW